MNYIQFPKNLLKVSYISANAKILYCVLYDLKRVQTVKRQKPYTEVKQKTLAVKMGVSERQIIRIINELRKYGLVKTERYANDITRYYVIQPDGIKTDTEIYLNEKMNKEN